MLDDQAKNRAAMDDDEGENQLLFGFESEKTTPATGNQEQAKPAETGAGGNLLDLDMMLGAGASDN